MAGCKVFPRAVVYVDYFLVCLFWPVSNHGVKIFEQTQLIFHWNLSKNNTLQFREWIQSISLGSAACGFFLGKLFTCPFSKMECKPSSRRFGTLIGTPQSTAFLNFVDECKVILKFQFHDYFIDWCSVLVFTVKFNFVHRATHHCCNENACITRTRVFLSCRNLIGPGQQHNQRNFP